ncbi:MAG: hypothetical protein U1A72_13310 [Sulfuritalea sp.]|nr:hypothetical protein [Sulfuritalea sp.]
MPDENQQQQGQQGAGQQQQGQQGAGQQQGQAPAWAQGVSEATAQLFAAKGWDKEPGAVAALEKVAGGYRELEKVVGQKGLIPPKPDATPEELAKWDGWDALGRPKAAADYKFKLPEGKTEWAPHDLMMQRIALPRLHAAGATQRQADVLNEIVQEYNAAAVALVNNEDKKALEALEAKWGGKDAYGERVAKGKVAMKMLGVSEERINALEGFLGSAGLVEHAWMLAERVVGEAGLVKGGLPLPGEPQTAEAAKLEIERIKAEVIKDKQHPYTDPKHPEHKAMKDKMQRLHNVAYGTAAVGAM